MYKLFTQLIQNGQVINNWPAKLTADAMFAMVMKAVCRLVIIVNIVIMAAKISANCTVRKQISS